MTVGAGFSVMVVVDTVVVVVAVGAEVVVVGTAVVVVVVSEGTALRSSELWSM